MTRRIQGDAWMRSLAVLAVLLCATSALAQPGGKGDQPQAKQAEGQGGMMGGQQGMGGMNMT